MVAVFTFKLIMRSTPIMFCASADRADNTLRLTDGKELCLAGFFVGICRAKIVKPHNEISYVVDIYTQNIGDSFIKVQICCTKCG